MGKLFLHSLRREALGAREGAKTQKKKKRNSFHLILLGVFAPLRGPTKASLYQGHGADLLTRHPDFQLLTKKILSSCEKTVNRESPNRRGEMWVSRRSARRILAPLQGAAHASSSIRWCRCAQPPATVWEAVVFPPPLKSPFVVSSFRLKGWGKSRGLHMIALRHISAR